MGEVTTYSCDVCGKEGLEQYANVGVTNSHYGRGGVWPVQDDRGICCSVECVRKRLAEQARHVFTDAELRKVAEQKLPDIASELVTVKAELAAAQVTIRRLEAVRPEEPLTRKELVSVLRELLFESRGR